MIHLYDGNNFVRRLIETDPTGMTPRTMWGKVETTEGTHFMIWDARDGLEARRKIFPGYKAKRRPDDKDLFVNFGVVADVLKHSRAIQVTVPGYEADDILAHLARYYAKQNKRVHIYSSDRDMLQVIAEFPELVTADCALKTGVLLRDIRYHKTVCGDTSDSIPGIKGFGEGAWDKADLPALRAWVDALVSGLPLPEYPFSKAQANWLEDPANQQLIRAYWEIIGFVPLTDELIAANMVIGKTDAKKAHDFLAEIMN